jgi:hypothetical protein
VALICFNLELNNMKQSRMAQLKDRTSRSGRGGFADLVPDAGGETIHEARRHFENRQH